MTGTFVSSRAMARRLWLRGNRHKFDRPVSDVPRLLVDISVIMQRDARTGIQRVVRAVWLELCRRHGLAFQLVPVFATETCGYREAPLNFLDQPMTQPVGPVAAAGPGDRFLGLDLAAHY